MPDDGIFLEGRPLLLDLDEQIAGFLSDWLNPDWSPLSPPRSHVDGRETTNDNPLPLVNYPPRPKIEINQLYWPTGATRWAQGHFLCDESTAAELTDIAHKQPVAGGSAGLKHNRTVTFLARSSSITFEAELYLLGPRPLTAVPGDRLWMCTLVDARYWWQQTGVRAGPVRNWPDTAATGAPNPLVLERSGAWTTWGDVVDAIQDTIGTITADAHDADYLVPDPEELTRRFDNVAALLDAVAHSIGLRVVRTPAGTIHLMNRTTSDKRVTDNGSLTTAQIAGDEWDAHPDSDRLLVAFPKLIEGHLDCGSDVIHWVDMANMPYTVDGDIQIIDPTCDTWAEATDPGDANGTPGASDVIFATAHASFSDKTQECPANNTEIKALARTIFKDYFSYRSVTQRDVTYDGLVLWDLAGYDDFFLLDWSEASPQTSIHAPDPSSPPELVVTRPAKITTRVRTLPQNCGLRHQFSQDSAIVQVDEPWFQLSTGQKMEPGGQATAKYVTLDDNGTITVHSPALTVTVYDQKQQVLAIEDELIQAKWSCERQRWETARPFGFPRVGKLASPLAAGATGALTIWEYPSGGPEGATSFTFTVRNKHAISMAADKFLIAELVEGYDRPLISPYSWANCP